ncbi:unnamed protein product [Merluccius merluccius]
MALVGHEQAAQLLHNKCVVVIGDSIQRSVYKDIVLLVQRDKYLSQPQLRSKGECTFESDTLVEGGCQGTMNNGTHYREVRQYRSQHHLVRFYFVTRVYSRYMQSVLDDLRRGPTPDLLVVNSCVWDISRYKQEWVGDYEEHLHRFFGGLKEVLPQETLAVWNLTMPLGHKIKGGFMTPEIAHRSGQLRFDVVEANFSGSSLACAYGWDVLDLHFSFRFSLQQRTRDGIHWNAVAHRRMTSLLLRHAAAAWGVQLPTPELPPPSVDAAPPHCGLVFPTAPLGTRTTCLDLLNRPLNSFSKEGPVCGDTGSEEDRQTVGAQRGKRALPYIYEPPHRRQADSRRTAREDDADYRDRAMAGRFQPYPSDYDYDAHPQRVMRNRRHAKRTYAPYSYQRPRHLY